jgi:hypothetical protein
LKQGGCNHDLKYLGVVNVGRGEEMIKVVEAWRCRRCGATKVGMRGPGTASSTEGVLDLVEAGESRWLILVWRGLGSVPPGVTAVAVRPGEEISVETPDEEERMLVVREDFSLARKSDGGEPRSLRHYLLDDVLTSWIDLSSWPPTIYTLRPRSG